MAKTYREVPNNYNEIENYVIADVDQIKDLFFRHEWKVFYDTCSILHHSNADNCIQIIEFLFDLNPIIVITRTVLMELTSTTHSLHNTQIEYFKKMNDKKICVILINEEMSIEILKEALTLNGVDANKLLGYAVKEVSKTKTAVSNILDTFDSTIKSKLLSNHTGSDLLFESFFQYARSQKSEGDSLAEELILICVIILTKLSIGKYILLSDDLVIRNNVISTMSYIKKHHDINAPIQITTSALVYKMYKSEYLTSSDEIGNILSASNSGNVKVYYTGEYDIEMRFDSFTKIDLINHIMTEDDFRIFY